MVGNGNWATEEKSGETTSMFVLLGGHVGWSMYTNAAAQTLYPALVTSLLESQYNALERARVSTGCLHEVLNVLFTTLCQHFLHSSCCWEVGITLLSTHHKDHLQWSC